MRDLIRILVAPLFWLAAFSAIYGLHGLSCSQHFELLARIGWMPANAVLIASWGAAILLQTAILMTLKRKPSQTPFVQRVSLILGWTALGAMIWTLFPVLLLSGCR